MVVGRIRNVHGFDDNLHVTPLAIEEDNDDNEDGSPLTEEQQLNRWKHKYDYDATERKVRAMRSDNQQIEALTAHILQI